MNSSKQEISSPCTRKCCLDEHDVCMGCGRTLQEIMSWQDMSAEEKQEIVAMLAQRKQ